MPHKTTQWVLTWFRSIVSTYFVESPQEKWPAQSSLTKKWIKTDRFAICVAGITSASTLSQVLFAQSPKGGDFMTFAKRAY